MINYCVAVNDEYHFTKVEMKNPVNLNYYVCYRIINTIEASCHVLCPHKASLLKRFYKFFKKSNSLIAL